jgi:hypothetical protein
LHELVGDAVEPLVPERRVEMVLEDAFLRVDGASLLSVRSCVLGDHTRSEFAECRYLLLLFLLPFQ